MTRPPEPDDAIEKTYGCCGCLGREINDADFSGSAEIQSFPKGKIFFFPGNWKREVGVPRSGYPYISVSLILTLCVCVCVCVCHV